MGELLRTGEGVGELLRTGEGVEKLLRTEKGFIQKAGVRNYCVQGKRVCAQNSEKVGMAGVYFIKIPVFVYSGWILICDDLSILYMKP